jgi:poly(3-hydroxybutyrate) depolymerase
MAVEPDSARRATQRAAAARALAGAAAQTRTLPAGPGAPIPYRVYAPANRAPGARLPLVVALHGAGGDENMFLEAYGAGAIRGLADTRGFIVVTPATMPMLRSTDALARLIDTLATELPVDRARVYLLGHSLGAAAAWNLARLRPDLVAAVVCISGACGGVPAPAPPRVPPLLSVVGELDPIAQPARVEAAAAEARAAGRAVEFRLVPGYGHTLVVGVVLPDVVDWLLRQPPLSPPPD